jgi:PAS domain S-box-containing protein
MLSPPAWARGEAPRAHNGAIDLVDWDFAREGIVGLDGAWEILWGRFEDPSAPADAAVPEAANTIAVPGAWNDATPPGKPPGAYGYATYRLNVACNAHGKLALSLPVQHSALRLYVNGRIAAVQGSPGGSPALARPAFVQQIAPLEDAACPLRIVAHVSNFDMRRGGLLRGIELGTERQLLARHERNLARDLFTLGGLIVLGAVPILFFFWRRVDAAPLWLGLYGLCAALFVGLSGERALQPYVAPLGWDNAWRIVFLAITGGLAAFAAFVRAFYPAAAPRHALRFALPPVALLSLLAAITPTRIFTQSVPLMFATAILIGAGALWVLWRAARNGQRGAWLMLAGAALLIGAVAHDTIDVPYLASGFTPYGLLAFALAPALVLARRFAGALHSQELRSVEHQQRADLLVRATQAGLLDWDAASNRVTYSERFKEMLGYPADADTSRWPVLFDFVHPEERERIRARFQEHLEDRTTRSGMRVHEADDFRLCKANGEYLWVHAEAISLAGADGRTLRHISSFIDISERKLQEIELSDRVKFIHDLFDSVPLALALRDAAGRYLFVNDTWERHAGTVRENVIGKRLHDHVPAAEADKLIALDRAALERGPHAPGKPEELTLNGKRYLQTRTVMTDARGRGIGVLVASLDTTERYAMEQALARERERLALLVRATKAGFTDWDLATGQTVYSDRFREMLGYPRDFDAWPPFPDMVHPEDRETVRAAIGEALRENAATGERLHGPLEYRLRKAEGSYAWVRGEGLAQFGAGGRAERFLTGYIDITHLREMNLALEESVRLREEVDRISRHDLKTPLNSIIGIPRLLRDSGRLSKEDGELLAFVEQAGYRLLDMVNLSLDMFRMEEGSYPLAPKAVDLRETLRKVVHDLSGYAGLKKIALAAEGPQLYALAEELLCYSMLGNLLKNAIEASPEGAAVKVSIAAAGNEVRIDVHNAGAVPQAVRARFFDKYSTAGKLGGTGLGTYSARLMARTQHGEVDMLTSESSGTTVSVRLLAAPAPAARPDAGLAGRKAAEKAPPSAPVSVLIVDDDENTRLFVERFIAGAQNITRAANGREALEAAMAGRPDAIIMDLDMPVMGGLEAAARIREWERSAGRRACAMIAMSSHDDPAVHTRCLEAGFDARIEKPVSPDALRREMNGLLSARKPVFVDTDLKDALPGFLKSRLKLVAELAGAVARDEAEPARALAHKLASGLALYGFRWAAGQGKMIERRAGEGTLRGLAPEVAALRRHLENVEVTFGTETTGEKTGT